MRVALGSLGAEGDPVKRVSGVRSPDVGERMVGLPSLAASPFSWGHPRTSGWLRVRPRGRRGVGSLPAACLLDQFPCPPRPLTTRGLAGIDTQALPGELAVPVSLKVFEMGLVGLALLRAELFNAVRIQRGRTLGLPSKLSHTTGLLRERTRETVAPPRSRGPGQSEWRRCAVSRRSFARSDAGLPNGGSVDQSAREPFSRGACSPLPTWRTVLS